MLKGKLLLPALLPNKERDRENTDTKAVKKTEQIHGDTKAVGTRTRATLTAYTVPRSSCGQQ